MRAVVLFSGGIDSLAALVWSIEKFGVEETIPLYVNMRHRYWAKEIRAAENITNKLGLRLRVAEAEFVGVTEHEDAHIPYRNFFLILTAAYYLADEGGTIVIQNVQTGETSVRDRTEEFNMRAEEFLNWLENIPIKIVSPFSTYTKGEIVKWLTKRISFDIIKDTIGCFSPEEGNCGKCPACFRRWISFETAGVVRNINEDYARVGFNSNPLEWEGVDEYIRKMKAGKYDPARVEETKAVLMKYNRW